MSIFSRKTRRNTRVGSVRRSLPLRLEQLEARVVLSTFTVINTDDSGAGSLRAAIGAANVNVGADIIQFASGVSGTITLTSGELAITDAIDLQGPGAGVITVSGNNASRVIRVNTFATISGLTITDGSASEGGGIYNDGTLTVESSTISGNSVPTNGSGGGIFNWGTLTVRNSTLSGNSAGGALFLFTNGAGGGITNLGTLTVSNSTLSGNSASYQGGGIANGGTLTVDSSTFSGNAAALYGGGILNFGALSVDRSSFSGNTAGFGGGISNNFGLGSQSGTATVHNSTLSDNSGSNTGGGIINGTSGTLTVDGSTLSGNATNGNGGGIANSNGGTLIVHNSTLGGNLAAYGGGLFNQGTLTLDSSTLSGNSAAFGGGLYTRGPSTLDNTIMAANFDGYGGPSYDIDGAVAGSSSHNLIGVGTNLSGISHGTNGNLIGTAAAPINPRLGALQGNSGPTQTMALLPGSPAINAGDNGLIPAGVTTDQRGTGYARIDNGTVDIGAYEFVVVTSPPVTFLVTNLADSGPGSLRQAILAANANLGADIVRFAPGLTGTITLTSGELAITDDAIDVQGPGAGVVTVSGDNASRVFRVTANATISGLTVSGGTSSYGGGIYNAYGTLTVQNSTLTGNSAAAGGGIYNAYGTLTVDGSTLTGNSAADGGYQGGGGGIYNANYGTLTVVQNSTLSGNSSFFAGGGINNNGTLTVDGSTLSGNSATAGGGIFNNNGTLTVHNSTFSGNSAGGVANTPGAGGGISNAFGGSTLTVDGSTFSGNWASSEGGGIANGGTLTVSNSNLNGNSTAQYGGGILNIGTLTVDRSTFSGNSAVFGGGLSNGGGGTLTVSNTTVSGNTAPNSGGGIFNVGTLTVSNTTLSGNSTNVNGGGILNGGTATVHNSTLSGNSAGNGGYGFGGGIHTYGTLTLDSSTLSGNSAAFGGGLYTRGPSTLDNTIMAANFDGYGGPSYDIDGAVAGSSSHNLIGVGTNLSGISHGSNGNLIGTAAAPINPRLGALQGNGGPTQTMALLPGSPAINAGANALIPAGVTTDQRGTGYARIDNGTADIGAYEFVVVTSPPVTFLVTNLADSGAGSLRKAILAANANLGADIVRFAPGLTGTITLTSGELAITDDAIDVQGPGAGVVTVSGDNASRVFRVTANATISGLTVSGGTSSYGGGIYNAYGTLTVQNSTLTGNSAAAGGGIYNAYGTLTVDGSTLTGNSAADGGYQGGGGGIYNANYGTLTVVQNSTLSGNSSFFAGGGINNNGTLTVDGSTLSGNSATAGGGIFNNNGTLTVHNSTFSGNSAGGVANTPGAGGGISNAFGGSTLTVDGSTFSGNWASSEGGGIANGGTLTVSNSNLNGNSTAQYGGGILNIGTLTVDRSTFSGNSAVFGGGLSNGGGGTLTVSNTTVSGNTAPNSGGGIFNVGTLTVSNTTLSGNSTNVNGGGILNGGTATVHNSTLSGNSAGNGGYGFGGGIHTYGTLTLDSSTLSGNSAAFGGGLYTRGPSTLDNTIMAANFDGYGGPSYDIDGAVAGSSSHNLIGVGTNLSGISHGSNGNLIGTAAAPINPRLGALQGNGGPTQTMALLPGSPAINAGANALIPAGVTTDQRGTGYARIDNGTVDIGAYELVQNHPPIANAGGPYVINEGGSLSLNGSGSYDPDPLDTLTYSWDVNGDGTFGDAIGVSPTLSWSQLQVLGINDGPRTVPNVQVRVDDGHAHVVDSPVTTLTVSNVAPVLDSLSATSVNENGTVHLTGTYHDVGTQDTHTLTIHWGEGAPQTVPVTGGAFHITHQYLDDNPTNTASDVYTIGVTLTDDDTGTGTGSSTTTITNVASSVGPITAPLDPFQVSTSSSTSASFTDPGTADTHTAVWNWGDTTTSAGTVTETNGSGAVTGSHIYTNAGVYTVTLTVTDDDGGSGQSVYQYVVTYDQSAGFVTGGGWINSPAGAYAANPALTGKANFGFVSRYQNGNNVPTGDTEFQFKVAAFNFKSTSYEWLVVSGAKARFRGVGTVNGTGGYGFELTAWDGQAPGGGGVDRFRIKIWLGNQGNGGVYDNMMGDDGADPTTALGGGSIVIHRDGSPLLAAGGPGPGTSVRLTGSDLNRILTAAINRWASAGLAAAQLNVMRNATVSVADLGDSYLGLAFPETHGIQIDDDAAGHGWFVDVTPMDDSEFRKPGKGVRDRMDLVSVVVHELGHLIGLDHDGDVKDVMGDSLSTGMRRVPTVRADAIDFAIGHWQATGATVSGLGSLDVRITDLPDATLALASGNTITLDSNAAGWGWFVGRSSRRGRVPQAGRMDLLPALTTKSV